MPPSALSKFLDKPKQASALSAFLDPPAALPPSGSKLSAWLAEGAAPEERRADMADSAVDRLAAQVDAATFRDDTGRSLADDYPEVARTVQRAAQQIPEADIPPETVPPEAPGNPLERLLNVGIGAYGGALGGGALGGAAAGLAFGPGAPIAVPLGALAGTVLGGVGGGAAGGALMDAAVNRGEMPGKRLDPLDITTGVLGTPGRMIAATGLPWEEHSVAELKGESVPDALLKALLLPQNPALGGETPRDWDYIEREVARRERRDPYSGATTAKALAKNIGYDPLLYGRALTKIPEVGRALTQIEGVALRAARQAGHADPYGFAQDAVQVARKIFDDEPFYEGALQVKKALNNMGPAGAEAGRLFDAEGFALGRRGASLAFTPATLAGGAMRAAGGLANVAGGAARIPDALMMALEKSGGMPASIARGLSLSPVAAGAGKVVQKAGRALGTAGKAVGKLGTPIEVIPARFMVGASKPARAAGEILNATPWGKAWSSAVGLLSPERAVFKAGMEAGTGLPGETTFDAFANAKNFYAERRFAESAPGHAQEVSSEQIIAIAKHSSSLSPAERAGKTITGWARAMAKGEIPKAPKSDIDLTTAAFVSKAIGAAKGTARIDDERGYVQALFDWVHLRAKELTDDGTLAVPASPGIDPGVQRDAQLAVRRAYAGSLDAARNDPSILPADEWTTRLAKVEQQFDTDLSAARTAGGARIDDDLDDLLTIHDALDDRLHALWSFAKTRYDNVLASLKAEFGEDAVEEMASYTRHYIQNRDRVLKRLPGRMFVGSEKAGAHREMLTLKELKDSGYDPVEDVLVSLEAAEYSAIKKIHRSRFEKKVLDKWGIEVTDPRGKGLTGATQMEWTHPTTGKKYWLPKEYGEEMSRFLSVASDPGKFGEVMDGLGQIFQRYLITPWKAWATYTRPAFHLRNAYSNLWLMWMGGYDPMLRPERLSEAFQIGSLARMEGAGAVKAEARAVRGVAKNDTARRAQAVQNFAADSWDKKLAAWGSQTYTSKAGRTYTGSELYRLASQYGVVNKRWVAAEVERHFMDTLGGARRWDPDKVLASGARGAWSFVPISQDSTLLKLGSEAGKFIENHARLTLFLDRVLEYGDNPADAALRVARHLFDYKELTGFQKATRVAIPFSTWFFKSTGHEMAMLMEHPERYAALGHVQRAIEGRAQKVYDENAEARRAMRAAGEQVRRDGGLWLWETTPHGMPVWLNPSMPFQQLNAAAEPLTDAAQEGFGVATENALKGVLGQMHPVFKLPIARYVTHTKFPEGRPLMKEREARVFTGQILKVLGVKPILRPDENGKMIEVFDEHDIYALENALPHLAVVSRVFEDPKNDPAREDESEMRRERELSGVSRIPVNPNEAVRARATELSKQLEPYTRSPYRR